MRDRNSRCRHQDGQYCAHLPRLKTAQDDLAAANELDLSTADRTTMALAFERLRGGAAELIRMELEHHPYAQDQD